MLSSLLESIESPADGVQIWDSHLEALSPAEIDQLDDLLDSSEHAKAARFHLIAIVDATLPRAGYFAI